MDLTALCDEIRPVEINYFKRVQLNKINFSGQIKDPDSVVVVKTFKIKLTSCLKHKLLKTNLIQLYVAFTYTGNVENLYRFRGFVHFPYTF